MGTKVLFEIPAMVVVVMVEEATPLTTALTTALTTPLTVTKLSPLTTPLTLIVSFARFLQKHIY